MQVTTPGAIRVDFVTQIKAIAPSHVGRAGNLWRYVRAVSDVPGPELRTFALESSVAQPFGDFVHGDGRDYAYELAVWTSYGALSEEDDDSIISEDAVQLSATLQIRYQPTVPGLISVSPLGWEEGDGADHGFRWGAHTFDIRYFAAHTA